MDVLTFLQPMSKAHHPENPTIESSSYCIFFQTIDTPVTRDSISGDGEHLLLELRYFLPDSVGMLRLRQTGTNAIIEETDDRLFCQFLNNYTVNYLGQLIMLAIRFQINSLLDVVNGCAGDMAALENSLDHCIDNTGTYQILDFRRKYTDVGAMVISVKEILARIDKGYYPMQMQSSYVLQGEVRLEFQFLEERYDLIKTTLIKDLDTYTSIINNNINRNTRLLSIISLVGVVLNFVFGSLLSVNPMLGIVGGLAIAALSAVAVFRYHTGSRNETRKMARFQTKTDES